jgi:hypothetical protein
LGLQARLATIKRAMHARHGHSGGGLGTAPWDAAGAGGFMGLGESMALLLNATTAAGVLGDDDDLEEDDEAVFLDVMDPNLDDPRQHVPALLERRDGGEGGASFQAQFEAAGLLSDRPSAAAAASGVAVRPPAAAGAGLLDSSLLPQPADAPALPQPAPAALLLLLPPPALAASSSNVSQLPSNQRASMPPVSVATAASSRRVTSAPLGSTGNAAAKLQSAIGKLLGKDVAEENPWKVRKGVGVVWGPVGFTTRWHLSGFGEMRKGGRVRVRLTHTMQRVNSRPPAPLSFSANASSCSPQRCR